MKFLKAQLFLAMVCLAQAVYGQGVGIGTNAPDSSAKLDIVSTNQGVLVPRMTNAQRNLISNPASGLMIFQTDATAGFYYNSGTPSSPVWVQMVPNPLNADLDMNNKKIITLNTPTANGDAANKAYVDNAVAAAGVNNLPSMVSSLSTSLYTVSEAVSYCDSLTEGGFNDWRLPSFDELAYFFGSSADSSYLWTKSLTPSQDYATNQNYISARLVDGKWTNGGIKGFLLCTQSFNPSLTSSTPWSTVATMAPVNSGNALILTQLKLSTYSSYISCCNYPTVNTRLAFNFADGTTTYSQTYSGGGSSNRIWIDISNLPLLNGATPLLSIDVEGYLSDNPGTGYYNISMTGYEISFGQKDGNKQHARCVR